MGKQKSGGSFPLPSRHDSPASSLRITSQCFCMNSTPGRDRCMAMRWTQWPTSASGSGIWADFRPRFTGRQVLPASSVRNTPAAEMAMNMRWGFFGSRSIVCRHMPPAPGAHGVRIGQRRLEVPDPGELPGTGRAVVMLVGAGGSLVHELVAHRLPGLAAVAGALDELPEPAVALGRIQPIGLGGRPLEVVH